MRERRRGKCVAIVNMTFLPFALSERACVQCSAAEDVFAGQNGERVNALQILTLMTDKKKNKPTHNTAHKQFILFWKTKT